jgi:hypothetical protein
MKIPPQSSIEAGVVERALQPLKAPDPDPPGVDEAAGR